MKNQIDKDIKVSIIVPVYNVEDYLCDCLSSLERQTLQGIEIIIINDGSTDNSRQKAQEFVERNDNFIIIDRENGGLSAARNMGLDVARGEFVYFLDSDDYLADNAMETLYIFAKENGLDVIKFSAYTFTDKNKDYKWERNAGYKYSGEYEGFYYGGDLIMRCARNDDVFPSCCLIFSRREVIDNNNLRFQEGIIHEDNLFHFELLTLSKKVAVVNQPLYYRRYRSGSITQKINWVNIIRSMCISCEEGDIFIETHPDIDDAASKWQESFFINTMFNCWDKIEKKQQFSEEIGNYFTRIYPAIVKYQNGGSISVRLFYISKYVYKISKRVLRLVKRLGE